MGFVRYHIKMLNNNYYFRAVSDPQEGRPQEGRQGPNEAGQEGQGPRQGQEGEREGEGEGEEAEVVFQGQGQGQKEGKNEFIRLNIKFNILMQSLMIAWLFKGLMNNLSIE